MRFGYPQAWREDILHKSTQNIMYTTVGEPKFTENLIQYKGLLIGITTTVGNW
ncbi:hypothetical protein [Lysinibacillus sp. ZYM-1]|uniref:hypothetical protein n=1 Tax=Lysinibacillus sp. ZYM-1 TaxID=1681184 RepID=UPI000B2F3CE2|nr:hypothetical protein [Lysinibacillus sp. ZYM-1]